MTTNFMSGRCFKTCQVSTYIALLPLLQSAQLLQLVLMNINRQHVQLIEEGCMHASKCRNAESHNYRRVDVPLSRVQKEHLLQESSREPHLE